MPTNLKVKQKNDAFRQRQYEKGRVGMTVFVPRELSEELYRIKEECGMRSRGPLVDEALARFVRYYRRKQKRAAP